MTLPASDVAIERAAAEALRTTRQSVFWTDNADRPDPAPSLRTELSVDLAIVGGGFTGLWAALQALEDQPGLRVAVLEAETTGFGASSRNGGFCDASLTHGLHNGLSHWPDDINALNRLGRENLDAIEASLVHHGIDCGFERTGEIDLAVADWQLNDLADGFDDYVAAGEDVVLLNADEARARVNSPTYLGGLHRRDTVALLDPARLVWGLRRAVEGLGGLVYDRTPVVDLAVQASAVVLKAGSGTVTADRVIVATNAYRSLVRPARRYVIPVYDHVLMTQPLTTDQMASIGWSGREGLSDSGNQFHYYRLSEDNRILWGGWDATYHWRSGLHPRHEVQPATHRLLAEHFFETFPQLAGLSFTHKWAGPIGTTSRFTSAWGRGHDDRVIWVGGYTGLGVGASRFGARVALDLAFGELTERTELAMVRKRPIPFPPEPLRWGGVTMVKRALQRADANGDERGPLLRALDRMGIGFDS